MKKKAKKTSLVIDRNKWLRGISGSGVLWDKELKAGCCLGHAAHILDGASLRALNGHLIPSMVPDSRCNLEISTCLQEASVRRIRGNGIANHLSSVAGVNDCHLISDSTRERLLKQAFAECGVKLSFVGPRKKSMDLILSRAQGDQPCP